MIKFRIISFQNENGYANIQLAGRIQYLEKHHFVVDDCAEAVHFLQIGVIFANETARYKSHHHRCNERKERTHG